MDCTALSVCIHTILFIFLYGLKSSIMGCVPIFHAFMERKFDFNKS